MTDRLEFAKYEGTGNDFVVVIDPDDSRPIDAELAAALCDRRFGVGADGTIRITRAGGVDFVMDHRNADGSHAEMCGNGIRCLGLAVFERGLTEATQLDVLTRGGVRHLSLEVEGGAVRGVSVQMGTPRFARSTIPMRGPAWETFLGQPFDVGEMTFNASAISMGNPHLVLLVDEDPERYHVGHIGPVLEHHELFPERTNVEFVRAGMDELRVRVWERGVGETLGCGTGACAALVAANEAGIAGPLATVRFPGGSVQVERREDSEVVLTGPATYVFDGVIDLDRVRATAARL